ncbi:MAG: hypothetical protein M9909_13525 [Thermomicrobiales bacterium]|nr:hypothetical protein [Thermomicrobiales bacterium]
MDVTRFKQTWSVASQQKESAAAKSHFLDLCALLGVPTPTEADPSGETYAFEKGASKVGGGDGYADVWYRGHFAIEYKGPKKDLNAAYLQVVKYKDALENPPLLVVCDLDTIRIHTNFTNTARKVYEVNLETLDGFNTERGVSNLVLLANMWKDPEWFRPTITPDSVTVDAAKRFSEIARSLQERGTHPEAAAHFLVQMVFCLFAEDIKLLPKNIFSKMISYTYDYPQLFQQRCTEFLQAMNTGGDIAYTRIPYVNGGLFQTVDVPELTKPEIGKILDATEWDWGQIEPAIFGTLFERSLDPDKRSQLGAHYTSKADIQRVVDPVVMQPLRRRFAEVVQKHGPAPVGNEPAPTLTKNQKTSALKDIDALLDELAEATILDPACGSGNFLYVALEELLSLELEIQRYRAGLTVTPLLQSSQVQPTQLRGIEINPYAQQLAQTAIWIGFLQWLHRNRHSELAEPILSPLDSIEMKDALLTFHEDGSVTETEWPAARFIIGNPPFLGAKFLRNELGDEYVDTLHRVFAGRIAGFTDLVGYFIEKARWVIEIGRSKRAGLLSTNSMRGGTNREILQRLKSSGDIYMAWSDEPWILDGAAVRISIIGFDDGTETSRLLNGQQVESISSFLTPEVGLAEAIRLLENVGLCYLGTQLSGPFDINRESAKEFLSAPVNPNGRPNSDVVRPMINAMDITRRPRNVWVVDFGVSANQRDASFYEAPFGYVEEHVRPMREQSRSQLRDSRWWLHLWPRGEMREKLSKLSRYIATPAVSKHRLFRWYDPTVLANHAVVVFAREDDYFFGALHSRAHELWSLRMGTSLEDRPRYTPTTTFETYPFPWPPGQEPADDPLVQSIGEAAKALDDARNAWLNPEGASEAELKKRTLTNLYNANPTWLRNLHATLDRAVDAYGWPSDEVPAEVEEDVILSRLLALNLERAGQ